MRLIQFVANRFDTFARRCWMTWRYISALGYAPGVAWAKAARREAL